MYDYDYPTYLPLHTRPFTTSTSGNSEMYISPTSRDLMGLKCSNKIVLEFPPFRQSFCSVSHWNVSHLNDDKSFSLLIMMIFMGTPTCHHGFPSLWVFDRYKLILKGTLLFNFGYSPKLVIFFPSLDSSAISSRKYHFLSPFHFFYSFIMYSIRVHNYSGESIMMTWKLFIASSLVWIPTSRSLSLTKKSLASLSNNLHHICIINK